ncbi:MAG: DNA-3-methyladenine glycosylase [Actinomycetaceae bacterium]|nr:DNA-3-methyladenine glycosylase [Actinomycetaceae bacterium]
MGTDLTPVLLDRATIVAPRLLGGVLAHTKGELSVGIRITEVEAYEGAVDPGSHAYRGLTPRTTPMFGAPPQVYIYLSYGIHSCLNIVCAPEGEGQGCLIRGGEVVWGSELMGERRAKARSSRDWARGPGNVGSALAVSTQMSGSYLNLKALPNNFSPTIEESELIKLLAPAHGLTLYLPSVATPEYCQSGRIGVSGEGGDAKRFPWRFYLPNEPSVSRHPPSVARQ